MRTDTGLAGNVAMVTGGASGIGGAVVRRFVEAGAAVGVLDLPEQQVAFRSVLAGLPQGHVEFLPGDLRDPTSAESAISRCCQRLGPPTILVTAAAVERADPSHTVVAGNLSEWHRVMAVNLTGTLVAARAVAQHMIDNGSGGSITTISSTAGRRPTAGVYSVSKASVIMLTRVLASELTTHGIRVNSVSPGYHRTPIMAAIAAAEFGSEEIGYREYEKRIPLKRVGEAEDVAGVVLFLTSEDARYVTGATIYADGGCANEYAGG